MVSLEEVGGVQEVYVITTMHVECGVESVDCGECAEENGAMDEDDGDIVHLDNGALNGCKEFFNLRSFLTESTPLVYVVDHLILRKFTHDVHRGLC